MNYLCIKTIMHCKPGHRTPSTSTKRTTYVQINTGSFATGLKSTFAKHVRGLNAISEPICAFVNIAISIRHILQHSLTCCNNNWISSNGRGITARKPRGFPRTEMLANAQASSCCLSSITRFENGVWLSEFPWPWGDPRPHAQHEPFQPPHLTPGAELTCKRLIPGGGTRVEGHGSQKTYVGHCLPRLNPRIFAWKGPGLCVFFSCKAPLAC